MIQRAVSIQSARSGQGEGLGLPKLTGTTSTHSTGSKGTAGSASMVNTKSLAVLHESEQKSVGVFVQLPRLQNIRFDLVLCVNDSGSASTNAAVNGDEKVFEVEFHSREFAGLKI